MEAADDGRARGESEAGNGVVFHPGGGGGGGSGLGRTWRIIKSGDSRRRCKQVARCALFAPLFATYAGKKVASSKWPL